MGIFSSVTEILERAALRQSSERRGHDRFNFVGVLELVNGSSRICARLIDLSYGGLLCDVSEDRDAAIFLELTDRNEVQAHLNFFDISFRLNAIFSRLTDGKLALVFQHHDASALSDLRYIIEPMRIGRELEHLQDRLTISEQLEIRLGGSDHTQVTILSGQSASDLSAKLHFLDGGRAFEVHIQPHNATVTHAVVDNSRGGDISPNKATSVGLRVAYFILRGIHCPRYSLKIHAICERLEQQLVAHKDHQSSRRAA